MRTFLSVVSLTLLTMLLNTMLLNLALSNSVAAEEKEKLPPFDTEQLVGHYKIVASEKSGAETPKDKIDGVTVVFTADKIVASDRDKKEVYSATYQVDPTPQKATISMVSTTADSKGTIAKGLIEIKGKNVKLIYTLPGSDALPTDFRTEQGQIMIILERIATKQPGKEAGEGR